MKTKEELSAYLKAYRKEHAEELEAKRKIYYANNFERIAARKADYAAKNVAKTKAYQAEYRAANRQKKKAYDTAYAAAHKEEENARRASHRARYPERHAAYGAAKRARKLAVGGKFTGAEFKVLCEKYGDKCLGPGPHSGRLTADHVIPLALGGKNDISNIQPLCFHCNSSKQARVADYRRDNDDTVLSAPIAS